MSFPPFNNESWEEMPPEWSMGSSLIWNSRGLHFDGTSFNNDNSLVSAVVPENATWANGYTPTTISFTIELLHQIAEGSSVSFCLYTTQENFYFENIYGSFIAAPGTYTITLPLVAGHEVSPGFFTGITSYTTTGLLGDVTRIGFFMGINDPEAVGLPHDREYTITNITFLPEPSELPLRWTDYVKTTETEI